MSISILAIDLQNDFCSKDGTLSVPGAEKDCERLSHFIENNSTKIDELHLTLDAHPFFHIAHPNFWRDENGKEPAPFTTITSKDFEEGKYLPAVESLKTRVEEYLLTLESRGRYQLTIWPPHCLIASNGFCVHPVIDKSVRTWERNKVGRAVDFVVKARNPLTEQYSAIHAEVPDASDPSTRTNFMLIDKLKKDDMIYVCGEALSHCVCNTLKDLCVYIPPQKITLLTDCTSSVSGYEEAGKQFINDYVLKGMKTAQSDLIL